MDISVYDWQQFKLDKWHGVKAQENNLQYNYPFAFIIPRIAEGICFWKFIRIRSSDSEFIGWRLRRDELRQFMSDENVYVRLIAMIESMPDCLWRVVLWKYNIDFMSLESFLRRITPEQVRQIENNFNDLYVDGILPRAYGFVQRKVKGLSTAEILSEKYDYNKRMMSKGSMSFDLLNLNFGFGKYPNGDNDDTVNVEISPLRFLSVKGHINDFVVNQENGRYWWMYRVIRSNLLWNAKKTVQLKPHICPGFWLTMIAHLLFWVISPMCAITVLPLLLMGKFALYHIPLAVIGALTPIFCLLSFFVSSLGEKVIEATSSVLMALFLAASYPVIKLYEWNSKLLDYLFCIFLYFVGFISFPFIYTRYFDVFFEKIFDGYPEWAFYFSTLVGYVVVGVFVFVIHGLKLRYRHTIAGCLAAASSLVMIILSFLMQMAGVIVMLISWVLYKLVTVVVWGFILSIVKHFSEYYWEYAMFIGGFAAFTALLILSAKVLDVYCAKIEANNTKKKADDQLDLVVLFTNVSIAMFVVATFIIFVVSIHSLVTIGVFTFASLPNYWLAAIVASCLFGAIYLRLTKINVIEKKSIVKHLHEVISVATVDPRWHNYVLNLGLNPDFIKLNKKSKIELLKKANEFILNHVGRRDEEKFNVFMRFLSLHMNQEGIKSLNDMKGYGGLRISEIMKIVLIKKKSASQAIKQLREKEELEESKVGPLKFLGGKIREYGLTIYRLYELFNERCPYIAKSKVLHL